MPRILKRLLPTLAALAFTTTSVAAQASVAGTWLISVTAPEGSVESEIVLEQEGTTVTGTMDHPMAQDVEITEGRYEDGVLSGVLRVAMEGQGITVRVRADVDGGQMTGELFIVEMGQAVPFRATRAGGG